MNLSSLSWLNEVRTVYCTELSSVSQLRVTLDVDNYSISLDPVITDRLGKQKVW